MRKCSASPRIPIALEYPSHHLLCAVAKHEGRLILQRLLPCRKGAGAPPRALPLPGEIPSRDGNTVLAIESSSSYECDRTTGVEKEQGKRSPIHLDLRRPAAGCPSSSEAGRGSARRRRRSSAPSRTLSLPSTPRPAPRYAILRVLLPHFRPLPANPRRMLSASISSHPSRAFLGVVYEIELLCFWSCTGSLDLSLCL